LIVEPGRVEPLTGDQLQIPDVTAIPSEPPDDILYHHKVRVRESAKLLWDHREIMYTLAERDFRAQYKQATLGILWAVLSPLATLAIMVVVFQRVKAFPTQGVPYALYAFVGILCWSFFSSSLGSGGNSLLANKGLMAKTQFPRECFPLETMLVNALNTVLSWVPLVVLFVIFGRAPAVATLWVPLFMFIEVIFAAGVTLAVASLIIQMRDLVQVLPIIISLGIFVTPVIWPFYYIPAHYHVAGGHLVHGHWVGGFYVNLQAVYGFFNPLGPVISSVRTTMLLGHNPSWIPLAAALVGSMIYLALGYKIFKRFEVNFADIA
jgi:ABC-type polysaccharide/polyol phosphate export permease